MKTIVKYLPRNIEYKLLVLIWATIIAIAIVALFAPLFVVN